MLEAHQLPALVHNLEQTPATRRKEEVLFFFWVCVCSTCCRCCRRFAGTNVTEKGASQRRGRGVRECVSRGGGGGRGARSLLSSSSLLSTTTSTTTILSQSREPMEKPREKREEKRGRGKTGLLGQLISYCEKSDFSPFLLLFRKKKN